MTQKRIDKKELVTYLISSMTMDMINIITSDNDQEIHIHIYFKSIFLKRYKLSTEDLAKKVLRVKLITT